MLFYAQMNIPNLKFNSSLPYKKYITIRGRKGCVLRLPSLLTAKFDPNQNNLATNWKSLAIQHIPVVTEGLGFG
jgi:hypothetical protein